MLYKVEFFYGQQGHAGAIELEEFLNSRRAQGWTLKHMDEPVARYQTATTPASQTRLCVFERPEPSETPALLLEG